MRASSVVIGFGSAVLALGAAGVAGWDAWHQFYAAAAGLGLGMAVSEAAGLVAWWRDEMSLIEQRKALTKATEIANRERDARLAVLAVVSEPELAAPDGQLEHAWRVALGRAVQAGAAHGFRYRDIAAGQYKVVEWEDWPALREPLIEMGVLQEKSGTRWADGWTLARWMREGASIPLPSLSGEPPNVELTVNTAQQQRPTTGQQPVIEHKAAV